MTDYPSLSHALENSAVSWGIDWEKLEKQFGRPTSLEAHALITELDEMFYAKSPNDGATWKAATDHLLATYPGLTGEAAEILVRSISYNYK